MNRRGHFMGLSLVIGSVVFGAMGNCWKTRKERFTALRRDLWLSACQKRSHPRNERRRCRYSFTRTREDLRINCIWGNLECRIHSSPSRRALSASRP